MAHVVRVGCSGWNYPHWKGSFYDASAPQSTWLEAYARVFSSVELNNSFYRLPEAKTFAAWRSRVPSSFVFAIKASRYLTHIKKLRDPADPVELFFDRARHLDGGLGPVLYQLPPRWTPDLERLASFLDVLPRTVTTPGDGHAPRRIRHAIEFRDPRWYDDVILRRLADHDVTLCVHDMPASASPRVAIGPFVYLRLHSEQTRYAGRYSDEALRNWTAWLAEQVRAGKDAYVYFNNDSHGHAPRDALRLRAMLKEEGIQVK